MLYTSKNGNAYNILNAGHQPIITVEPQIVRALLPLVKARKIDGTSLNTSLMTIAYDVSLILNVREDEVINAVKFLCDTTSEDVEAILNGNVNADTVPFGMKQETWDMISALARDGKKINAIKELREYSGLDLKGAKEYIERVFPNLTPKF